jgi:ribosome-associated toxin RatA of RatAB toxin-antitoxin module
MPAGTHVALVLLAAAGVADGLTPEQRTALQRRDVIVEASVDADSQGGDVRAAIRIDAPAARIYAAMTRCETALVYVPHLRECVVRERDPEGRFEVISHVSDLGWYMPASRYTFRATYDPPRSVDFVHVAGDFRENTGRWELVPVDGGRSTVVTYRVRVVPKVPVPQWVVRVVLRRELPRLLEALRGYVEAQPR